MHNFFRGLSLTKPTGKISMSCIVFYMKTLKCWNLWNFKMKCIKTLQIGNQQSMKIMISSPKSRGADPGHRRLKEKGISRSAHTNNQYESWIFATKFLFIYFLSFLQGLSVYNLLVVIRSIGILWCILTSIETFSL